MEEIRKTSFEKAKHIAAVFLATSSFSQNERPPQQDGRGLLRRPGVQRGPGGGRQGGQDRFGAEVRQRQVLGGESQKRSFFCAVTRIFAAAQVGKKSSSPQRGNQLA